MYGFCKLSHSYVRIEIFIIVNEKKFIYCVHPPKLSSFLKGFYGKKRPPFNAKYHLSYMNPVVSLR